MVSRLISGSERISRFSVSSFCCRSVSTARVKEREREFSESEMEDACSYLRH